MKKFLLSDICDIQIGRTPSRANPSFWGGKNPWLSISDMGDFRDIYETKECITDLGAETFNGRIVKQGTVLFSFKLSIGKVGIARVPLYTNEAIASLEIKDKSLAWESYLYYVLKCLNFDGKTDRAVMGKTLNKKKLSQIKIPLPLIAEQRRIASILDKADEIRRKRQEAIKLTEELGRSLFLDMFGDPVTNPNGWELRELKDVLSIVSGQVDPKSEPYIDMPHIGGENIESHTNRLIKIQTPRELGLKSGKYLFRPDDVLYSKIRPYLNKVSIPYFEGVCSADIYPLRVKKSEIEQNFLAYLLRSQFFLDYAEKHSTRTNIPKINRPTLLSFQFPCPPMEKQKKFSDECNKVSEVQKSFKKFITESENLFNSLLQRAFKGEL